QMKERVFQAIQEMNIDDLSKDYLTVRWFQPFLDAIYQLAKENNFFDGRLNERIWMDFVNEVVRGLRNNPESLDELKEFIEDGFKRIILNSIAHAYRERLEDILGTHISRIYNLPWKIKKNHEIKEGHGIDGLVTGVLQSSDEEKPVRLKALQGALQREEHPRPYVSVPGSKTPEAQLLETPS
ncbi:MAG: hypothetical protein HQL13_07720, partial [Candidatus Omnitrophica bacterium]|nr:hypothetical protein [Candidatus Omnitrophota bacterium]